MRCSLDPMKVRAHGLGIRGVEKPALMHKCPVHFTKNTLCNAKAPYIEEDTGDHVPAFLIG